MGTATIASCRMPLEKISSIADFERTVSPSFMQKIALVIPTFREAGNLPSLLERIHACLEPLHLEYEVLIVDDDSCDGTAEIVNAMSAKDVRVRLLVRKGQRGLSGAVLHGWENTDAPIVGVMDGDLQHPPELLPRLMAEMLSGCDLCIGSRYTQGGAIGGWHPLRRLLSAAAILATWPIQRSGLRARDPMSGFFFVRRRCLERISFQQSGFKLLLDILVRAQIASVCEVPFAFGRRYRGASKANLKVAFEYVRLAARLYSERLGIRREIPLPELD